MEPYGVGHRRPQFSIRAAACSARPIKYMSPHLSVKSEYIELMYFSGAKNLKLVESDVEKRFIFEVNISHFRGREYIKGFIRDMIYDGRTGRNVIGSIFSNSVARAYAAPWAWARRS